MAKKYRCTLRGLTLGLFALPVIVALTGGVLFALGWGPNLGVGKGILLLPVASGLAVLGLLAYRGYHLDREWQSNLPPRQGYRN